MYNKWTPNQKLTLKTVNPSMNLMRAPAKAAAPIYSRGFVLQIRFVKVNSRSIRQSILYISDNKG